MSTTSNCDKLHNGAAGNVVVRRRSTKAAAAASAAARNFGRALYEVVDNQRALFSCPMCRRLLTAPVTGHCGHTLCAGCVRTPAAAAATANRCTACGDEFRPAATATECNTSLAVNVLVQDVCSKWRERHPKQKECSSSSSADLLGFEPRYTLRSRPAGLLARDDCHDAVVTRTVRLLLSKSVSERRKDKRITERELNRILHCVNLIKERHVRTFWKHVAASDLECVLCSRVFHEPVTTRCGHTFCRGCLARVVDHGLGCPLCMAPLSASDECAAVTRCVDDAVRFLFPRAHAERVRLVRRELRPPGGGSTVPVFVCTNAFPGVACPLYVYEPRYRLLARRCLQSATRRFAMVARLENNPIGGFAPYGTMLEVKDAVHLHNGTSILTTIGVRRFKVASKGEQDGYDTATVQYIRDARVPTERLPALVELHRKVYEKAARWVKSLRPCVLAEVENCIGEMPPLEEQWFHLPDGPAWAWWLMPILPLPSKLQIGFLCTTDLEKRLRAIDKLLEHIKIKMRALKRNTLKCNDTVDSGDSCRMWTM